MKNVHSFFSWQGNQLDWPSYSKWIVLGITLLLLVLIWVFKNKIKAFFKRKEEKVWDTRLAWLGAITLVFQVFKLILYVIYKYPLHWELLWLHICRIHMIVICVLLIIKKKELIKYVVYISTMGALFAMYFGTQSWDGVAQETNKEVIFKNYGYTFYHVGVDNFFYWDFFLFHITLVILPIILWTGFGWKIKTVNLYRTAIVYILGITLIWSLNVAFAQASDIRWWANNWYIGTDKANDYSDALGIISAWPQNLFAYLAIGVAIMHVFHYIWIVQSKERKTLWKEYKEGYKNIFRNIISFR